MRLRVGGVVRTGPAIDARDLDVAPRTLLAAIRSPGTVDDTRAIEVTAPSPGPIHGHVGLLSPGTTIPRRTTLAAAARSRGVSSTVDPEMRKVRNALDELEVPPSDVPGALAAVTASGETVDALRDRVARLGGVVAATGDAEEVAAARADLRTAAAELAEAETSHHAARQRLDRERVRQRAANDARERRLRMEDRLANLERRARRELADRERPRLERALAALPDWPKGDRDAAAALAVARIADLRAPVVLVGGPFRTAGQARAALAAPVFLASPTRT